MKILVADDDGVTLRLLQALVTRLGHEVVTATDGGQALRSLESEDPPGLALLDWSMPVMNGLEVCARVRGGSAGMPAAYLILVTARSRKADIVEGLRAGANDYVTKPFDAEELAARIDMGIHVSCLERKLRSRTREIDGLRRQLQEVQRHLPTCAGCHAPRTDQAFWDDVAAFLGGGDREPSCPDCLAVASRR